MAFDVSIIDDLFSNYIFKERGFFKPVQLG